MSSGGAVGRASRNLDDGSYQGLLIRNGLPGPVLASLDEDNLVPKDRAHYTLEIDRDPMRSREISDIMLWTAGPSLLAGMIAMTIVWRRDRRFAPSPPRAI